MEGFELLLGHNKDLGRVQTHDGAQVAVEICAG